MFDRRLIQYFDWGLMGLAILIGCVGLITLFSAVTAETPTPQKMLFFKQLLWFGVGLVAIGQDIQMPAESCFEFNISAGLAEGTSTDEIESIIASAESKRKTVAQFQCPMRG